MTTGTRARTSSAKRKTGRVLAGVATFALLGGTLAACGGGNGGSSKPKTTGPETTQGQGGKNTDTGGPGKPGGSVTIALTAETTGGWCLQEATLAAGGIQVARAIYDTLTVPDDKGNYVPFLAKAVTPNSDFTKWTIELRSGIKFSDGTDLTAQVVKNNLDAYRGKYPARKPQLFLFVYGYIKDVKATGPLTVEVDMNKPWTTFPAHLYEYGRLGIEGQAQLDSGKECFKKLIGTGPFMFKGDWAVGDHFTAVKNPNYWRKDAAGNALPYLDKITFRPIIETSTLVNGIQTGALDMAVTDDNLAIKQFMDMNNSGRIQLKQTDQNSEISYTIFNTKKAPFNNIHARLAFAYAIDSDAYNKARQAGLLQKASGPFAPGVIGYLADSGLPSYDPVKAKAEVAAYKQQTGKDLSFSLGGTNSSDTLKSLQFQKRFLEQAGMKVTLHQTEESQYIQDVIYGNFDAAGWRNHPGFDPDTQYVWWHCDNAAPPTQPTTFPAANTCNNLVNFSGFNDAVINKALDDGRTTTDAATRQKAYEDLNREFAKQLWEAWGYYVIWSVPYANKVHGVNVLKLPTADSVNATGATPFPGYSSGVDPAALWVG